MRVFLFFESRQRMNPPTDSESSSDCDDLSSEKLCGLVKRLATSPTPANDAATLLQECRAGRDSLHNRMASGICVFFIVAAPPDGSATVAKPAAMASRLVGLTTFEQFQDWARDAITIRDSEQATRLRCALYVATEMCSDAMIDWAMGFSMAWAERDAINLASSLYL
jgi:hypothetical protein